MSVYLPVELRRQLEEADDGQCVYCQTRVDVTGQALTADHILPTAAGGATIFANFAVPAGHATRQKANKPMPLTR